MTSHPTRRELLALEPGRAVRAAALAQQAGDKTVKFILPNATGSGVDAITRAAQAALGKALGSTVIVDNQPGAGGIVGLQALARSAPDGFTLSVVSNNVVILPSVYKTHSVRHAGRLHARSRSAASRRSSWSRTRARCRPRTPRSSPRC